MEDIVEEVEKTATKIMPFIKGFLASGHGVHILTAPSEHRTKPKVINGGGELYSIEQLPSTGGLPTPVKLTGLPDGGHARDEAKRWICFDNNYPSFHALTSTMPRSPPAQPRAVQQDARHGCPALPSRPFPRHVAA